MRRAALLLPLLLSSCSCQPPPAAATGGARAPTGEEPAHVAAASTASETAPAAALGGTPIAALSAVPGTARSETAVVRQYVGALVRKDHTASDAHWHNGGPGSQADDRVLRELPPFQTLRVTTGNVVALDQELPSRRREVPVQVRVATGKDTLRFDGHYRLQLRADGGAWEIYSGSVQPALR